MQQKLDIDPLPIDFAESEPEPRPLLAWIAAQIQHTGHFPKVSDWSKVVTLWAELMEECSGEDLTCLETAILLAELDSDSAENKTVTKSLEN